MEENGTYRWSAPKPKKQPDLKKIKRTALLTILFAVMIVFGLTCYYTVDDKQQAVVTTFGKVTDITDAGVHLKLPFGIQQVEKVDVNVYQKITLGYNPVGSGYTVDDRESAMITGDYNIVNVDFFVEYKISDPVQYLYSSNDPESILRNLVQSQVRNVVGSSTVDSVLTTGKENIQTTYQAEWSYNLGLRGYAWKTESGGAAPNDTALGTGTNWEKVVTSNKDTAGVLLKTK